MRQRLRICRRGQKRRTESITARCKTGEGRFGTGALKITNATNPFLYFGSTGFGFGSGAFTIECWYKTPNTSGSIDILTCPSGNPGVRRSTTNICGTDNIVGDWGHLAISTGTYYHLAFCSTGYPGTYYFFRNGELGGSSSSGNFGTNSQNAWMTGGLNDYIDSVRITKGIARYTSAFTALSTDFPERGA